jgi:hypothetical protein
MISRMDKITHMRVQLESCIQRKTLEKIEHKKSKNTLGSHPEYARRMTGDIK